MPQSRKKRKKPDDEKGGIIPTGLRIPPNCVELAYFMQVPEVEEAIFSRFAEVKQAISKEIASLMKTPG